MNSPAYLRSLAARFLHRSEVAEDMEDFSVGRFEQHLKSLVEETIQRKPQMNLQIHHVLNEGHGFSRAVNGCPP